MLKPESREKYLQQFDQLIQLAKHLEVASHQTPYFETEYEADVEMLKAHAISLLDPIIPEESLHRKFINDELSPSKTDKNRFAETNLPKILGYLVALRSDFEHGLLDGAASQIEGEVALDYLDQAALLMATFKEGNCDYIPAAVLMGAILEKGLRSLCERYGISTTKEKNGMPVCMDRLIESLGKKGVISEVKTKEYRLWASIRNKAAHGELDCFTSKEVELMLSGIREFIATYFPQDFQTNVYSNSAST